MIALLTSETFQMINVAPSPHDHLKSGYHLTTCRAIPRIPEQSEVVPLAKDQIRFGVERGAHLAKPAIAAAALEAVFVPEEVQGLQKEALRDGFAAAGAVLRAAPEFGFGASFFDTSIVIMGPFALYLF